MKPSIEKIVFNVRGKKLELTQDEAKELKGILLDLFGDTKVVHEYHSWPYRYWSSPWPTYTIAGASGTYDHGTLSSAIGNATSNTLYLNSQTV